MDPVQGHQSSKLTIFVWLSVFFVVLALVLILARAYRESSSWRTVYGETVEKNEVISQMETDLLKSVEAEKNAVLADTDEESRDFAQQAISAQDAVTANSRKLARLVEDGRIAREQKLLKEFGACWSEFRKVDQQLLDFAVQNTNLKAARLSFTKAREALNRFEVNLAEVLHRESASPNGFQIADHAYTALSAAFDIYALEAPHIIETSDAVMDKFESAMALSASKTKAALEALGGKVGPQGRIYLQQAQNAFSDFLAINSEIVMLSRRNTNIRSMELSLGVKRKITADCLEFLAALQQEIRDRTFRATR